MKNLSAIILAAGQGKRLKSQTSKIVFPIINKPTIFYVLDAVQSLGIEKTYIIIGHQAKEVKHVIEQKYQNATFVLQAEQLGTGHAVMQVEASLPDYTGDAIILSGDVPLLSEQTITNFYDCHQKEKAVCTVLTTTMPDATGYGRIIRKSDGSIQKIVEHKDASPEELAVREINSGIYIVSIKKLFKALSHVKNNNTQHEYYLTDIIEIIQKDKDKVWPFKISDYTEVQGINSRKDLMEVTHTLYSREIEKHLNQGVSIISAETTFIDPGVEIEADVIIEPFVTLKGKTILKQGTVIKSFTALENYQSHVGEIVQRSML